MATATLDIQSQPYTPRGAADDLFYASDDEVLIEGPAGTGKTRGVLEKVKTMCRLYPGSRALLVRKTRESMTETVLVEFETSVIPESMISGDSQRNNRQRYDLPNGSEIVIGGMDKPGKVMSAQYDLIAAFEATELTQEDWEMLQTRLRNNKMPYHQGVCDCNPDHPNHWLNVRAKKGHMRRLISRHKDNPALYDDGGNPTRLGRKYINKTLEKLSGARRARLLLGNWAAADDMVYPEFDPAIHCIDKPHSPIVYYFVSVDWGYRDPGVFGVWGVDNDRRMYLVYQVYRTEQYMKWWLERGKKIKQKYQPKLFVCDHDLEKIQQLRYAGLPAQKAKKDIELGIMMTANRLQVAGDGLPRIFFLKNSLAVEDEKLAEAGMPVRTEDEFWVYKNQEPKEERNMKAEPVDYCNHGMDMMRYAVVYLDRHESQSVELRKPKVYID